MQALSDAAYGVLFKFAPALAGAQQEGGGAGVRNEQMVDEAAGAVLNRVRLPLGKSVVEVTVEGECEPGELADELRVTFTRTSVALDGGAPLRLPLPRAVGTVANSYCDDDLRVSRGGRGGVFVLRRLARDLNDDNVHSREARPTEGPRDPPATFDQGGPRRDVRTSEVEGGAVVDEHADRVGEGGRRGRASSRRR